MPCSRPTALARSRRFCCQSRRAHLGWAGSVSSSTGRSSSLTGRRAGTRGTCPTSGCRPPARATARWWLSSSTRPPGRRMARRGLACRAGCIWMWTIRATCGRATSGAWRRTTENAGCRASSSGMSQTSPLACMAMSSRAASRITRACCRWPTPLPGRQMLTRISSWRARRTGMMSTPGAHCMWSGCCACWRRCLRRSRTGTTSTRWRCTSTSAPTRCIQSCMPSPISCAPMGCRTRRSGSSRPTPRLISIRCGR